MSRIQEIRINLHKAQDDAIFARERFVALVAGIQSGKTVGGAIWSRMQWDENLEDGLICSPTYKILQQSTLPKFFEINPDLRKYYKKSDQVIEFEGRGRIYIRSTENPNVIEGMTLRWVWADEAGQMSYDAWIAIQGRVAFLQGKVFLTTTPYAMNWLYTDFFKKANAGVEQYKLIQFKSIDNPYFPKEEFERAKKELDKRVFERRYCGMFTKMEGLVYEQFQQGTHTIKREKLPKQFEFVLGGIDWGYEAPTGITIWGQNGNAFYLIDEFKRSHLSMAEIIEKAKELKVKWKVNRYYADSAEPDRIAEFRGAGFTVFEGNKDIVTGVNAVRQIIIDSRLFIAEDCKYFLEEIESYHYPEMKEGKEEKEVPEKVNDHLCLVGSTLINLENGQKKRLDKISIGDRVKTQKDFQIVIHRALTRKKADVIKVDFSNASSLIGTKDHKIYTKRGIIGLDALRYDDIIETVNSSKLSLWEKQSYSIIKDIIGMVNTLLQLVDIKMVENDYTKRFGKKKMGKSQKDIIFTIKMEIQPIIKLIILNLSNLKHIYENTLKLTGRKKNIEKKLERIAIISENLQKFGTLLKRVENGTKNTVKKVGKIKKQLQGIVKFVGKNIKHIAPVFQDFAIIIVKRKHYGKEDVYNITVANEHNYYANGILVKNCDATRYIFATYSQKPQIILEMKSQIQQNKQARRSMR